MNYPPRKGFFLQRFPETMYLSVSAYNSQGVTEPILFDE